MEQDLETILKADNMLELFYQMLQTKSQYIPEMHGFLHQNIIEHGTNSKNLILEAMLDYWQIGMIDPRYEYIQKFQKALEMGDNDARYFLATVYLESTDRNRKQSHTKEGLKLFFEARKINPTVPNCFTQDSLDIISFIDDLLAEKDRIIAAKDAKILELIYAPGGPGYQQAKSHFESLSEERTYVEGRVAATN